MKYTPDNLCEWMLLQGLDPVAIATILECRYSEVVALNKVMEKRICYRMEASLATEHNVPGPLAMEKIAKEAVAWYDKKYKFRRYCDGKATYEKPVYHLFAADEKTDHLFDEENPVEGDFG